MGSKFGQRQAQEWSGVGLSVTVGHKYSHWNKWKSTKGPNMAGNNSLLWDCVCFCVRALSLGHSERESRPTRSRGRQWGQTAFMQQK